ncbi:hypothetical protein JC794_06100 [Morganella morganii]|uniref:hypothetical protein n=1 Tax=Morganella morganii TaxID=582 RepID=UPI000D1DA861|nr:hypothetical protein [Morganella morganii]HAE79013.1 hypothetical protein [Morganella sp. (in: enterobacteria)]QXO43759.1 hypothetical protein CXB74_005835 [Morganella morganii]QXO47351.1 hypothetical protein JC862_05710 [Morganella morganii]QXO51131.1 hypothetical protein JC861_05820 [Morganella morganii]QXO54997.1 hypothetical protein JC830_05815 [Morganella morganii]
MGYKYDPVRGTVISSETPYGFEERPDYDELHHQANLLKIKSILGDTTDDENVAALITVEEAEYVLKNTNTSNPFQSAKEALFGVGDVVSNFSGSVYESGRVFRIINEFKDIGIKATEYVGKNGNVYIRLSGHAGVRAFLNATRYLADNPKILYMGVGTQGQNAVSAGATRFSIVYSLAYRVVELIFKDEYTLTDFFVNVTMDMAKLAVSMKVGGVVVGYFVTAGYIASGSVIVISLGIFFAGLVISYGLYKLDDYFGISESIIRELRKQRKPRSDGEGRYHADNFFMNFGRNSRG